MDGFDMRTLLQYHRAKSDRVIVPIEEACSTAVVDRVGQGAEIPLMFSPIEGQEIVTYKIGRGYMITHEMAQYQQIPVIEHRLKRLALEMKNTANIDVITAIGAGVPVANIIACTGTSLGNDGTVFTIAGTIGQYDITNGIRILEENYKGLKEKIVFLVNPIGKQQVSRLPHYSSKNQYGKSAYMDGMRGSIEGTQVIVSNLVPANTAFLIATDPKSWRTGQYTPVGFFIESRPLEVLNRPVEHRDGFQVFSVWEYGVGITYGEGIVKLTFGGASS